MGVSAGWILARDPQSRVAVDAEDLAVTNDACAWIGRGLLIVHRDEVGAVHGVPQRLVEVEA